MEITRAQQQELDRRLYDQKRRSLDIRVIVLESKIKEQEKTKKTGRKSKNDKEMHISIFK